MNAILIITSGDHGAKEVISSNKKWQLLKNYFHAVDHEYDIDYN
jgi:hypothetical protein